MVITNGSTVSIEYTLTVDGQVVDTSDNRGPLTYKQGSGQIIPGLEKQLTGLKAGEEKSVVVPPAEAYGEIDPGAVQKVPLTTLPKDLKLEPGMALAMQGNDGQQFPVTVKEVDGEQVTLDLNHPLAGKTLQFQVKVVKVE